MELLTLSLKDFRNYASLKLELKRGINCFFGNNAQGKSNLLEAVSLICTGRSFRTHHLKEMIRLKSEFFLVEAVLEKEGLSHRLSFYFDEKTKRIELDHTTHANFYPLLGFCPLVTLSTEDIAIIQGGPSFRRRFLDLLLAQLSGNYVYFLTRYHKALKQRNIALKEKAPKSLLDPWEEIMADSALVLVEERQSVLAQLQSLALKWLNELSTGDTIYLSYRTHAQLKDIHSYRQKLLNLYQEHKEREILLGQSLIGPHRDDMELILNGKLAESFASEGQKRILLIALKLASYELLSKKLGISPLLAIDDFGVFLDEEKKKWTLKAISNFKQVLVTAPSCLTDYPELYHVQIEAGKANLTYDLEALGKLGQ